jgi:hypothetical protein
MRGFRACVAAALSLSLLVAGCATPTVTFNSRPPNALVQMGDQTAHTPCKLPLPKDCPKASVTSPLNPSDVREVQLPEYPGSWTRGVAGCADVAGDACTVVSVPFFAAGALGLIACGVTGDGVRFDDQQDDTWWVLLAGGSLGCLLIGAMFATAGSSLEHADMVDYRVYVDFLPPSRSSSSAVDYAVPLNWPGPSTNGLSATNVVKRSELAPWVDASEWLQQQRTNRVESAR